MKLLRNNSCIWRRRCRAAGRVADRDGAILSVATSPHNRRHRHRRRARHPRRLMGNGSRSGSANHSSPKPAGWRPQYRIEAVVRAAPDGYTLLLVDPSAWINATLDQKLNYNFIRDIRRSRASSSCPSSWWYIRRFRPRPFLS